MASDEEKPEAEQPTTVDTPATTPIRPPTPREPADRWIPVEITAPQLGEPADPKPPHQPKHAAEGLRPSWSETNPVPAAGNVRWQRAEAKARKRAAARAKTDPLYAPTSDISDISDKPDLLESGNTRWQLSQARRERLDRFKARPGVRFLLPGMLLAVLLAAAGVAGAVVVPAASKPRADASASPGPAPQGTNGAPVITDPPASGEAPQPDNPSASPTFSPPPGAQQRPADVYGAWAAARSVRLDIPVVALQAYGYAEAVTARSTPKCHLTWTTLAGIGKIESDHGRTNGSVLQDDGRSVPPVIGPPLDGQNNRQSVADTDQGVMDNDRTWDRAVGPMQFLPATWKQYGLDADANGVADIDDIDDAALTAAAYLCEGGRDLSTVEGWNAAVHAYNLPEEYRAAVFNATNDYGRRDRQG